MNTNPDDLVARLLGTMPAAELMRVAPLTEVARLRGTSTDTVIRDNERRVARGERSRIVQVSQRRRGMRVIHALCLDAE
jgi:hypothetical protein